MPDKKYNKSAGMVDISAKTITRRKAIATATIVFNPGAFEIFLKQGSPKGNVLETAKIAAIMAAKSTPAILPLCHPLGLDKVSVSFEVNQARHSIDTTVEVISTGKTGVEMEALTATAAACLTIYDMMKWTGQTMVIEDLKLTFKSGGQSGVFRRKD